MKFAKFIWSQYKQSNPVWVHCKLQELGFATYYLWIVGKVALDVIKLFIWPELQGGRIIWGIYFKVSVSKVTPRQINIFTWRVGQRNEHVFDTCLLNETALCPDYSLNPRGKRSQVLMRRTLNMFVIKSYNAFFTVYIVWWRRLLVSLSTTPRP